MKKNTFLLAAFTILAFSGLQTASAQLPVKIKIPKASPSKPEPKPETKPETKLEAKPSEAPAASRETPVAQPQLTSNTETKPASAEATQDQPTVAKDSIQITAFTNNSYRGNYDIWSWVPKIRFRVNGPIASGSQLYVEFTQPGGTAPWVKFDCATQETQKGYWWDSGDCGGRQVEDKGITAVGVVSFAIKLRNELAGTDATIFAGKAKVEKTLSNEVGPKAANKFVYFINHDWNLPIGYIFYSPDDVYGWDYSKFNVAFWVRGEPGLFEPHIFYKGQEVGKVYLDGRQIGKPSCDVRVENNTTHYVNDGVPQKAKWARVECTFYTVKRWDKTNNGKGQPNTNEMFKMASNPGEYEVKVLRNNRLARSIKFTVGPEGTLDWSVTTANKLGNDRGIVPVMIIGDQDGTWNRLGWKTEAFWSNPLTGFTISQ